MSLNQKILKIVQAHDEIKARDIAKQLIVEKRSGVFRISLINGIVELKRTSLPVPRKS